MITPFFLWLWILNRAVDHIHLIADDRLDAGLRAQLQQFDGAVHDAVIGEGQGRHAQGHGPLHHGRQLGGPVEEAVVAVVMEGNERQGGGAWGWAQVKATRNIQCPKRCLVSSCHQMWRCPCSSGPGSGWRHGGSRGSGGQGFGRFGLGRVWGCGRARTPAELPPGHGAGTAGACTGCEPAAR